MACTHTHTHTVTALLRAETLLYFSAANHHLLLLLLLLQTQRKDLRDTESVHCLSAYHAFSCLRVEKKGDVSGDCIIRLGSVSCRRRNLKQIGTRKMADLCAGHSSTARTRRHWGGGSHHRDHKATLPFCNLHFESPSFKSAQIQSDSNPNTT